MNKKFLSLILSIILITLAIFTLTACGEKEDDSGLDFTLQGNTYVVTGIQKPTAKVTVPSTYNGKKVTAIGEDAFRSDKTLEEIVLPSSVTTIEESAFNACSKLRKINLSNVTTIDDYAFKNSVVNNIDIMSVENLGKEAFSGCSRLTEVALSSKIATITRQTFANCSFLKKVTLPSSVKTISEKAFYNCSMLNDIDLSNVNVVENNAFESCVSLTNVSLDKVYAVKDHAFASCSSLKTVTIGETCAQIYMHAFRSCGALTSLSIADSQSTTDPWCYLLASSNSDDVWISNESTESVGNWVRADMADPAKCALMFQKGYNYGCYTARKSFFKGL